MDRAGMVLRDHHSGSAQSEESAFDLEINYCNNINLPKTSPTRSQAFATGCQLSENNAAYFSWPAPNRLTDAAEVRLLYFGNFQKGVLPETHGRWPTGLRATTLLELMTIRVFHSKLLRCFSLGTTIGFQIRRGALTDIPNILVFVARKVHRQWITPAHCLPSALEEPGCVWCDVDVVEFSLLWSTSSLSKGTSMHRTCRWLRWKSSMDWIWFPVNKFYHLVILCSSELLLKVHCYVLVIL